MAGEGDSRPLTIRELFPAGDVVAEWVYTLSVLCDDLGVIFSQLKPAMEGQHLRETLFFARQLFTRLYEAGRLIAVLQTHPQLEQLVVGSNGQNSFGKLLIEVYRPRDGGQLSVVEETYGRFRHQTVHLMWPGSDELQTALDRAGFLPARIWASESGPVNQWVHGVSGMLLFGDVQGREWMQRFAAMNDLAGRIATAWIMLFAIVLPVYAKERRIDLNRVISADE